MKRLSLFFLLCPLFCWGNHKIVSQQIKTLQVVVNQQWMSMPIMELRSADHLYVSFDEMSHNYHRFICHLEPCNPDWSPVEGLFESDWLSGFNDLPIEDYENSRGTVVDYTHYKYVLPNDRQSLKMSGNYRLHIIDDNSGDEVAIAEFRVVEPLMKVGLSATVNTDKGLNDTFQQVEMTVNYNGVTVSNPDEQLQTFVMQNGCEHNMVCNPKPTYLTPKGLQWSHRRELIFDGGNEYHKFEMLDESHTTMGLDHIEWSEEEQLYHAFPYPCAQQPSYVYDEDANGAFYIRNSDNFENDITSEYIMVHYILGANAPYYDGDVIVNGKWTTEEPNNYVMEYDEDMHIYHVAILQKMGYYNYQLLLRNSLDKEKILPEEGNFFQTENQYQAFVYYKPTGGRTWRLVGFQEITFKL